MTREWAVLFLILVGCALAESTTAAASNCVPPPPEIAPPNALGTPCRNERRAAIDIGSGSIKLLLSDLKICGDKVEDKDVKEIPVDPNFESQKVDLLAGVNCESKTVKISKTAQFQAVRVLSNLKTYAICQGATTYVGIATYATREAENQLEFLDFLRKETGLKFNVETELGNRDTSGIQVVSQYTEGKFGFDSAMGHFKGKTCTPENSVVWDIGGGSSQITHAGKNGDYEVAKLKIGSACFHQEVLRSNSDLSYVSNDCAAKGEQTPNPIGKENVSKLVNVAKRMIKKRAPHGLDSEIKNFKSPEKCIIGIGSLHSSAIYKAIQKHWLETDCARRKKKHLLVPFTDDGTYTQEQVLCVARFLATKSDADPAFCHDPFSTTNVTNLILIAGFMESLGLKKDEKIRIAKVNPTNQLFTNSHFHAIPFSDSNKPAPANSSPLSK